MKKYILILLTLNALSINAQAVFAPTKEQLANVAKIKELQKTNKGGINSKKIIELMNANRKIEIQKIEQKKAEQKKSQSILIKNKK
jgi:hypothetical protein